MIEVDRARLAVEKMEGHRVSVIAGGRPSIATNHTSVVEGMMTQRASMADGLVRQFQLQDHGAGGHQAKHLMEENHIASSDPLELAIATLFRAYDLDESDTLSEDEFLKLATRLCFEKGEVFKDHEGEGAQFSIMDGDRSGLVDYIEFRERHLRVWSEEGFSKDEILDRVTALTKAVLTERVRMGPRYHAGIRQVLKKIFSLYDISGDGFLSPEEWIAAQKVVAAEIMDDLDESWIDEAAFNAMDENGDGQIQLHEFLESSFQMFEGVKTRVETIYKTLQRVRDQLEKSRLIMSKETEEITLFLQTSAKPHFRPPTTSWQDEPTEETPDLNAEAWKVGGYVQLPVSLQTLEEVVAIVRLSLHIPTHTWFSLFVNGTSDTGGTRPVQLLRGDRPGTGNVQATLEWMTKPNAVHRIYVKNVRKRPQRLGRQIIAFLEEREAIMKKYVGQTWGIDWATQILGEGVDLPYDSQAAINVGDAILVEVPKTDNLGEYRFASSIYMDGITVLSRPVEETASTGKGKKAGGKKGASPTKEKIQDEIQQLIFVALTPGTCVFFIDLAWEDQEEKLAAQHKLTTPVAENSIARIGPLLVRVEKQAKDSPQKPTTMWWNGCKWTKTKGSAKKKGRKKR